MTISFRVKGTAAIGAVNNINPSTGAGCQSTDISMLTVQVKGSAAGVSPTITTPSGWTLIDVVTNNGTLVATSTTGSNTVGVYYKVGAAASTAIGVIAITNADSVGAGIVTYATSLGLWVFPTTANTTTASDTTSAADETQVGASGLDVSSGDWIHYGGGVCSNGGSITVQSFSAMTGCTLGTMVNQHNNSITTGTTSRLEAHDIPVTAGASNSVPTLNMTNTTATTGHGRFTRLRDWDGTTPPPSENGFLAFF